jgi:hypothetical protein
VETLQLDAPHNYNRRNREAVYRFFGKHVLGENDPAEFQERGIRLEKLQDMLALHNRTLPAGALSYDELFVQWVTDARALVAGIADRTQLRETLGFALGAEWPAHVVSEADGEKIAFTRPGRGDRVAGFAISGKGAKVLFVHPDGAEAARKSPEFAALLRSGRPIFAIDAFQTGAAIAPRAREAKMFLTFNRTDDANRVQDILTVLAWLNEPNGELVGLGKAAIWCQFAAALCPYHVQLKADLGDFTGTDDQYLERFFVPGIQRAGGLQTVRRLLQ